MMQELIRLKIFSESELIFDEEETRAILIFFFQAARLQIEIIQVTNELRKFAQGLLVEAVDATYAMGWIELSFRWVVNPGSGMKKALQKLGRAAARHWFKHLKTQSLFNAKIYERVRDQLARNFRSPLQIIIQAKSEEMERVSSIAFVRYGSPRLHEQAWG